MYIIISRRENIHYWKDIQRISVLLGKILALICLYLSFLNLSLIAAERITQSHSASISIFPIVMYDSDIGFGLGGKGVLKNGFHRNESFDLTLFGSSKGEQWYVFAFSIPDGEIRQGKTYPLALDLKLEFDKYLKSNYFGFGNHTQNNDHQFPLEFLKIRLALSRSLTDKIISELAFQFTHYAAYDFNPSWQTISSSTPGAGETELLTISPIVYYDTRDSRINPRQGIAVRGQYEFALQGLSVQGANWNFNKIRFEFSGYHQLFINHIIAFRFWLQQLDGQAPYQEYSVVGGGWTARGYKANRFLDRAMVLTSLEYRFPLWRKLGGVIFSDLGRVYPVLENLGFTDWHSDWGIGLRYYLADFVVRLDTGFSSEGTRIFLNFAQVF